MTLSILQLNLFANKFKRKLFPYLRQHDFDVLLFQEITGPHTTFGNIDSPEDNYGELQKLLGDTYKSEISITDRFTSTPTAYFANAIFYKKAFHLLNKREVFMKKNDAPFPADSKKFENLSRSILELTLRIEQKPITFLTTHFAWGGTPFEKPHQTAQGKILLKHLASVNKPFIFTGDMNIEPDQPTIHAIENICRNLITENRITNTLNPRTHVAKHMFPKGAAVDYIFVSDDVEVKDFEMVQDDISDHLGLITEIEL